MPLKDGRDYLLLIGKTQKKKKRFTMVNYRKLAFEFSYGMNITKR